MPRTVRITRRAARQIEDAARWWGRNRPAAPGAVASGIERAFALLIAQPHIGANARSARLKGVRRIHLDLVNYDLYYRVRSSTVEVLAFWHSSRGSGPGT